MSDRIRQVPFAKPWLDEREADAARRAILTGWVTQGPEVAAFEQEFAQSVGADHACAVSSCTAALHLALRAVGVGPGDEVVTVSHSYIATANAVRHCGALPVFVDIDPVTYNIDPTLIESALTDRTRAILCPHQMGMPCDLEMILVIGRRYGLPVVEDAACGLGSEVLVDGEWAHVGRPHGDVACFSFHPRKLITTGDGGMLTTSNPDYDRQFRLWRHHGMNVSDLARHAAREITFERYPVVGYNYRMTDIVAAVGREQLKRVPVMVRQRRKLADRYAELLPDVPGLGIPREPACARSNWQTYCVRLPAECDQREVMQFMLDRGVATRRGVMCAHREQAYADMPLRHPLPQSEQAQNHTILLPMFHELTANDQEYVAQELSNACQNARPCITSM